MTVQSVGSVIASLGTITNQAGKPAATEGFGSLMSSKANDASNEPKQPVSRKQNDDNRISKSEELKNEAAGENVRLRNRGREQDASKTATENPKEVDVKDLEQVIETIATLLNSITQVLEQGLNTGEEELLNGAMDLDLTPTELLDTDNIKELFLNISGAEPNDLIADDDLLSDLRDVIAKAEELLEDSGIREPGFFKDLEALRSDPGLSVLEDPAFNEVVNEYLAAGEETGEDPEFTVEIEDLRTEPVKTDDAETSLPVTETVTAENGPKKEQETGDRSSEGNDKEPWTGNFVNSNAFVKNLAKAAEDGTEPVPQNTFRDLYDISGQTIRQIRVSLTSETSHMEIRLNPEHLGKVEINISSKNGAVTAELTAHNEAARRALEAGLEDLRTALNDNGLKVENIEVNLAQYGFRQNEGEARGQQSDGGRRGRRRAGLESAGNETAADFDNSVEIMKEMNGGNVDYVV